MPKTSQGDKRKKRYETGDYRALSVGIIYDVEHWFNPLLGIVEPFIGVVFKDGEEIPVDTTFPPEEQEEIPEIVFQGEDDDGMKSVTFQKKEQRRRWFVDSRLAVGLAVVPLFMFWIFLDMARRLNR